VGQGEPEVDVKSLAKDVEARFTSCSRREVVARFDRKQRKKIWQKQGMGPPANVLVDVRPNDSVLYPYLLIVEFTLVHTFGAERATKEEAEKDTELKQLLGELLTAKYRNTYLVSKDGIRLRSREFFSRRLDGSPGTWRERTVWQDACWDQIGSAQR